MSKDSGNQYGMDNMSAILIRFNKKWSYKSNTINKFIFIISIKNILYIINKIIIILTHLCELNHL